MKGHVSACFGGDGQGRIRTSFYIALQALPNLDFVYLFRVCKSWKNNFYSEVHFSSHSPPQVSQVTEICKPFV